MRFTLTWLMLVLCYAGQPGAGLTTNIEVYYVASSVSGQDEPNNAL